MHNDLLPPRFTTTCNDLIAGITNAIIRQEGAAPDSTNPGNIRVPLWMPKPWPMQNGFWLPVNRNIGIAGIAHIVALHVAEGDSLAGFIRKYAPPSDHNNTRVYVKNVATWAVIPDILVPLWTFITDKPDNPITTMTLEQQLDVAFPPTPTPPPVSPPASAA